MCVFFSHPLLLCLFFSVVKIFNGIIYGIFKYLKYTCALQNKKHDHFTLKRVFFSALQNIKPNFKAFMCVCVCVCSTGDQTQDFTHATKISKFFQEFL
jgi:hypothetical protein